MAYITAAEVQTVDNASSYTVNITPSATGDLIMLFIMAYQTASISSVVGNNSGTWTQEIDASSANNDAYVYSCVQAATPDTSVTVTFGAAEYAHFVVMTIKEADTTTIVDVSATSNNTASYDIAVPSVTTTNNNGLILRVASVRSYPMFPIPGLMSLGSQETASSLLFAYATWDIQETAGATGAQTWQHAAANTSTYQSTAITVAINDAGSGVIDGYVDRNTTPYTYLAFNSQYNGRLGQAFYDPTGVVTSLDNGSYTNSNIHYISGPTADNGALENGIRSLKSFEINTYAGYSSLTGVEITETAGSTDNYDLSGSLLCVTNKASDPRTETDSKIGACFAISDKTYYRFWQLPTSNSVPSLNGVYPTVIDIDDTNFVMDTFGTVDTTSVGAFVLGAQPVAYFVNTYFGPVFKLGTIAIQGGSSARPASFDTFLKAASKNVLNTVLAQGGLAEGQFFVCQNIQIGGTTAIYFDSSNQSVEFPPAYNADLKKRNFKIGAAVLSLTVNLASGSTCVLSNTTINFGNYHNFVVNTSVAITSQGLNVLNSTVTITSYPSNLAGITFVGCKEIAHNSNSFSGGCAFDGCVDTNCFTYNAGTEAAIQALIDDLANCEFLNNNVAIRIEYTGSGDIEIDFTNINWSGNTTDIHYDSDNTSALTAVMVGTSNATTTAISGNATGVTIQAAVNTLSINSDTASTLIRYFTDDSQTVVDSITGTTLDYEYSTTDPIDIELVKQGYVPVNRQNVTPYDGDYDVIMDFDEAYNSAHALTITSEYDFNRGTDLLTINSDQNALDVRSALADLIRTNSSYYNTPLHMVAIPGLTRIDLTEGMTITSMATWKGAGMERFDAADSSNPVEKWFAIKSVGAITGATTHYRQTSSGTSTAVTLTNNVVDEAFQYWSDPNHDGSTADGYDYSDYMVIKAFLAGSRQARVDVVANAGVSNLSSNLYTVPLANVSHDYSGTDPGISGDLTLVTGGTVGGKTFAYKWVDAGTNTGADIADQLNYNAANDPTATIPGGTGLTWFELGDMVIYNATAQETERCLLEGASPAYKGFYVERGGNDHPSFTRFQADDGTYYVPSVTITVSAPNLIDNTRVRLYNTTAAVEVDNSVVSGGSGYSISLVSGVDYTSGDNLTLLATYHQSGAAKQVFRGTGVATTADITFNDSQTDWDDPGPNTLAIDGSAVSECATDYIEVQVEVTDSDDTTQKSRIAAFIVDAIQTEDGIRNWVSLAGEPVIRYVTNSHAEIDADVATLEVINVKSASKLSVKDTFILAWSDGVDRVDAITGSSIIWISPDNVLQIETGVSGLTASESSEVAKIGTIQTDVQLIKRDQGLDASYPKTITENTAGTSYDETFDTVTKEVRKSGSTTTITRTA